MRLEGLHDRVNMAFPITYTFTIVGLWGGYFQKITLNHFILPLSVDAIRDFAWDFWSFAIARAITIDTELVAVSWECHNHPWLNDTKLGGGRRGQLLAAPAAREDSAVIAMSTGYNDPFAHRRWYMPGIPRGWVSEGVLTAEGLFELEGWCRVWLCALSYEQPGVHYNAYHTYPAAIGEANGISSGMALRPITHLTLFHHTARTPFNFG